MTDSLTSDVWLTIKLVFGTGVAIILCAALAVGLVAAISGGQNALVRFFARLFGRK